MFRDMRRRKQELSDEEVREILLEQKRGVLAVVGDGGYPYALPVNFVYTPDDERIYIHCAKVGHKIDAIVANPKVCFTTHDEGWLDEDGWSYHVRSVVAFGTAELVADPDLTYEKARALGRKYFPTERDVEDEMRTSASRVQMIAIAIDHITGKIVHER